MQNTAHKKTPTISVLSCATNNCEREKMSQAQMLFIERIMKSQNCKQQKMKMKKFNHERVRWREGIRI
jgi:hypothetical protein